MHPSLQHFHPVIAQWFEQRLGIPTPPQVLGWPVIAAGDHGKSALILAPTGSGKTLAAFLVGIDSLAKRLLADEEGKIHGIQILYISPLKSLANDVQKNLIRPLEEIAGIAAAMKVRDWPEIHVATRTGDTPQKDRAAMLRRPPHILITTPESLNLLLTTGARGILSSVRTVIVDEVHALAGSKRGVFLSLLLERLEEDRNRLSPGWKSGASPSNARTAPKNNRLKIAPGVYMPTEPPPPLVRIGLSATARPEELIAKWLAGNDEQGHPRPMEIIRSGQRKLLDLQVVCPFTIGEEDDLEKNTTTKRLAVDRRSAPHSPAPPNPTPADEPPKGTGHWPEVTRAILQLIREHKSTLVFGNSRQLVERLASRFEEELAKEQEANQTTPQSEIGNGKLKIPVILPHHGSIAKEVRLETEQALKRGELDAVLATSSLELGIDIGSLDLVVQIDSPGNVAAGLQRVGRAGHLEKATAKGRFVVRGSYALPAFAALLPLMFEGVVEETRIPENCLDVLAQQIVAACVARPWKRADLFRVMRRAMPYRQLSEKQFDAVVAMLSKRAERVTNQGLRPRLSFDRVNDELIIMPGTAQVVMLNSGVIADTGQYPVYLAGATRGRVELKNESSPRETQQDKWGGGNGEKSGPGIRLGELDEEFVYETKEGDRIILGSQTWRVTRIDADRVLVEPAAPGSSRMPFWRGESAPRSEMLGEAVAKFHGEMEARLTDTRGVHALACLSLPEQAHPTNTLKRELRAESRPGTPDESVSDWLMRTHHFDEQSADNALIYYQRQLARGALPTDKQLVIEHFHDRTGEPVIAILNPLGRRINYTLRLALEGQFAARRLPAQVVHHDDGIIIRPPVEVAGGGEIPANPLAWLKAAALEEEITDQLEGTALFGLRFRQNAARALMLPKMTLAQRTPLWQQRLRARHLLALVKKQRNFPIIIETYRECLQDVLNIPAVADLLTKLETGALTARIVRNASTGSPFAQSLFSQFQQAYLYEWDDPLVDARIEPSVDPKILDDILQRKGDADHPAPSEGPAQKKWEDADEAALRRRIWGLDYPARTSEELLEKIEATGSVGLPLHFETDPRFADFTIGGTEECRRMLEDLSQKRRLLLVDWTGGRGKGKKDRRWIATENLAPLLAARGKLTLHQWTPKKILPLALKDLPAAILETTLISQEARRLLVEQTLKREPTTTPEEIATHLPWMQKEIPSHLAALQRKGLLQILAQTEPVASARPLTPANTRKPPRAGGRTTLEVTSDVADTQIENQKSGAATAIENSLVWSEYAEQLHTLSLRRQRRGTSTADLPALQRHLLSWHRIQPSSIGVPPMFPADQTAQSTNTLDATEDALDMLTGLSFPLEFWEHGFAARVPEFSASLLDGITRSGHRVWTGNLEGGIAFWPRHLLADRPTHEPPPLSPAAQRLTEFLKSHGASFQFDIQLALTLDDPTTALALAELTSAGIISNDHLESLRDILRLADLARRDRARTPAQPRLHATHARHISRPSRLPRNWWKSATATTAGSLGGRWFLLPPPNPPHTALDIAQRAADRTDRLLRRTAFACRELLEPIDGTWKDNYDVLTRMEWAGTVRRGYFVDGIAGSQFALPTPHLLDPSPDPLHKSSPNLNPNRNPNPSLSPITWLSMLDPANIWSRANTRWISDAGLAARVPRAPGNWIALLDGRPVLAATAWATRLIPLPAPEAEQQAALATLHSLLPRLPRHSHPYLSVRHWDQRDILNTPAEDSLHAQGFTRDPQGMRLYRQYSTPSAT